MVKLPEPLMVPPLQLKAAFSATLPVPPSVPPLWVYVPLTLDAPFSVSRPPVCNARSALKVASFVTAKVPPFATVMFSVATRRPTAMAVLTVTVGFAAGPRSISTVSVAPGTNPVLQLVPVLKLPLKSVFQTFTPEKTKPR